MTTAEFINELAEEVCHNSKAKGFWEDYECLQVALLEVTDKSLVDHLHVSEQLAKIALMHSELSEAAEGVRKDAMDDKLTHRKALEVELADTVIRILDFAGYYSLDLGGAIIEKLEYNLGRPYKHGKKV